MAYSFFKMDQSRPLFVYFLYFLDTISIIQIEKSINGLFLLGKFTKMFDDIDYIFYNIVSTLSDDVRTFSLHYPPAYNWTNFLQANFYHWLLHWITNFQSRPISSTILFKLNAARKEARIGAYLEKVQLETSRTVIGILPMSI